MNTELNDAQYHGSKIKNGIFNCRDIYVRQVGSQGWDIVNEDGFESTDIRFLPNREELVNARFELDRTVYGAWSSAKAVVNDTDTLECDWSVVYAKTTKRKMWHDEHGDWFNFNLIHYRMSMLVYSIGEDDEDPIHTTLELSWYEAQYETTNFRTNEKELVRLMISKIEYERAVGLVSANVFDIECANGRNWKSLMLIGDVVYISENFSDKFLGREYRVYSRNTDIHKFEKMCMAEAGGGWNDFTARRRYVLTSVNEHGDHVIKSATRVLDIRFWPAEDDQRINF